jgi:hypothetical protein
MQRVLAVWGGWSSIGGGLLFASCQRWLFDIVLGLLDRDTCDDEFQSVAITDDKVHGVGGWKRALREAVHIMHLLMCLGDSTFCGVHFGTESNFAMFGSGIGGDERSRGGGACCSSCALYVCIDPWSK